jgi:hypothetical protein
MKKIKFDAKQFLGAEILSPLEQNKIRGGFADAQAELDNVVVRVQRVQRVVRVVVIA